MADIKVSIFTSILVRKPHGDRSIINAWKNIEEHKDLYEKNACPQVQQHFALVTPLDYH